MINWENPKKTSYIPKNKWPSLQAFKSTPADLQTAETKSALQNLSDFMSKAYDKIKSEKKLHLTDTEILQEIILSPVVHILGDSMMRDVGKMIYQKSKYQNLNLWIESDLNTHFFPGCNLSKYLEKLQNFTPYPSVEYVYLNIGTNTASTRDGDFPLVGILADFEAVLLELKRIYPNAKKFFISELLKRWDSDGEPRAVCMNRHIERIVEKMNEDFDDKKPFSWNDFGKMFSEKEKFIKSLKIFNIHRFAVWWINDTRIS